MEGFDLNRRAGIFVLVFAFIALAYANTLFSPFNFDDTLVIKTEIAQGGEQYFKSYPPRYRHLFYLSLAINYSQAKLNPFGYHLVNISLHFLAALFIFFISFITIKRGTEWGRHAGPIAVITTLFFAISPVHTETVTYISGRASGLAGLFYLSSLSLFILGSFQERKIGSRALCYLFSLVCFVASALSKETGLTLPAIILLYDFCFMRSDRWTPLSNRFLFYYLPLLACGAFIIFKVLLMKSTILYWLERIDFAYALKQIKIVSHGFQLLLLPIGLTFDYDFPDGFFSHPALRALPVLIMAVLLVGIGKFVPKSGKMVFFCVLWFLLTIAPTNSFLPRMDLLSERNLYLPSFGVFLLFSITIHQCCVGVIQRSFFRNVCITCLASILILQAALLVERNAEYRSNTILWEDTVKKAPGKTRAWHNLTHFYLMDLNYEKVLDSLHGLIQSNPSRHYLAFAHSKLGVIHSRQGNLQKAIAAFEEGIRLDPSEPINHLNLGGIYLRQGKFTEARDAYEKAERLFKSTHIERKIPPKLYLNKAHILFMLGLYEQAETATHTYLNMVPGSGSAHSLLGNIYAAMGKEAEASREFAQAAKSFDP